MIWFDLIDLISFSFVSFNLIWFDYLLCFCLSPIVLFRSIIWMPAYCSCIPSCTSSCFSLFQSHSSAHVRYCAYIHVKLKGRIKNFEFLICNFAFLIFVHKKILSYEVTKLEQYSVMSHKLRSRRACIIWIKKNCMIVHHEFIKKLVERWKYTVQCFWFFKNYNH